MAQKTPSYTWATTAASVGLWPQGTDQNALTEMLCMKAQQLSYLKHPSSGGRALTNGTAFTVALQLKLLLNGQQGSVCSAGCSVHLKILRQDLWRQRKPEPQLAEFSAAAACYEQHLTLSQICYLHNTQCADSAITTALSIATPMLCMRATLFLLITCCCCQFGSCA